MLSTKFLSYFVFLMSRVFLHSYHQDENVPWYSDEKWDFVRGNLSSVDRDYGWAHGLTHNIGTHQVKTQCELSGADLWVACSDGQGLKQ